ncbi:hypothetical protein [Deinococcus altitudinis]
MFDLLGFPPSALGAVSDDTKLNKTLYFRRVERAGVFMPAANAKVNALFK